jgi:Tfp pilus assembly PilM family ATPase
MRLRSFKKLSRRRATPDEVIVLDLSTPITRAVHLRQKDNRLTLLKYCSRQAPTPEDGTIPVKALVEHFKSLRQTLGARTRKTVVVIGMDDSALRNIESPAMERTEMRHALRLNTKHFLKEDMPASVFDCFSPPCKISDGAAAKSGKPANVLVGITKQDLPGRLNAAARLAGLHLTQIVPAQVGLANAALLAKGTMSSEEALVLLHIGPKTSTVSFLSNGTLSLTRAIDIGSETLSKELSEAYNVPEEDEKGRISVIQDKVQSVLEPVAKEVRAAIDYFDHLEGKPVLAGYVTGELAQSSLIIETLKGLEIPCQRLDPTAFLTIEVTAESLASSGGPLNTDLETDLPQLEVAIGAAVGWLKQDAININLLVEELEAAELRRRDPVRLAIRLGAAAALLLIAWTGWVCLQTAVAGAHLRKAQAEWKSLEKSHLEALTIFKKAGEIDRTMLPLQHHATNRFLWALPLDALQEAMVDDVQVVGLKMEQTLVQAEAVKAAKNVRAQPAQTREQILLTITAKNFGDTHTEDKFIERMVSLPYFKDNLRKKEPVLLKNRLLRQVDPLDPAKTFTLFTIECVYPERVLGHE